jgi:plasmid stabilization system protein ParE
MAPELKEWLLAELRYATTRNPLAAEKVVARMRAVCQTMAEHPRIGLPGVIPGTRHLVVKPYVLTVRLSGGVVEIAAIRHARPANPFALPDMRYES